MDVFDLPALSKNYFATEVLVYKNLTSQYTIPKKAALAIIISEMASILLDNPHSILVSNYTKCNRY